MGKRGIRHSRTAPRRRWGWVWLGAALLAVGTGGGVWWFSEARDGGPGTPRLVVDREVVDLGYLPFDVPVRVVFTVSNTGDGVLRLTDAPRVKVVKGC